MTSITGLGLLGSAFAPLVALLTAVRFTELGWISWLLIGLCLLAWLVLGLALRGVATIQARTVETTEVRREDERVLGFTSSYVVPVVVALFGAPGVQTLVATAALVVLLAVIYVRGGLYHLNPTLALLGYRLYEVTAANGTVTMLLGRRRHLPQRGQLECRYLGDDVAFLKGS